MRWQTGGAGRFGDERQHPLRIYYASQSLDKRGDSLAWEVSVSFGRAADDLTILSSKMRSILLTRSLAKAKTVVEVTHNILVPN